MPLVTLMPLVNSPIMVVGRLLCLVSQKVIEGIRMPSISKSDGIRWFVHRNQNRSMLHVVFMGRYTQQSAPSWITWAHTRRLRAPIQHKVAELTSQHATAPAIQLADSLMSEQVVTDMLP